MTFEEYLLSLGTITPSSCRSYAIALKTPEETGKYKTHRPKAQKYFEDYQRHCKELEEKEDQVITNKITAILAILEVGGLPNKSKIQTIQNILNS